MPLLPVCVSSSPNPMVGLYYMYVTVACLGHTYLFTYNKLDVTVISMEEKTILMKCEIQF